MLNWMFELNNQPMSAFTCGVVSVPAFSGLGKHANHRSSMCMASVGPIPVGTYYIFDRQSGGVLGSFYDLFNDRRGWFALYAADGKVDDETYCQQVKRGAFRLHPKGISGRSEGCITIEKMADFHRISAMLRGSSQTEIPGTKLKAYGKVIVK